MSFFSDADDVAKRLAREQEQRKKIKQELKKQAEYAERKKHNPLI